MKQIIPFKKDLLFKTKVSEITSISLEHNFKVEDDVITGEFHINGDYKMTDGSIQREVFDFKLPFDIALDSRYKKESMIADIDNFYYKIINDDTLQVHIDLFVDGEKIIEVNEKRDEIKFEDLVVEVDEVKNNEMGVRGSENTSSNDLLNTTIKCDESLRDEDFMDNEILGETEVEESKNINQNINININDANKKEFNIFDNVDDSETYKAYYVYIVKENDTIDQILEKYHIIKEEIAMYNDIETIKPGDKVIIPSKNE